MSEPILPAVSVRGIIRLGQFLKLANLVEHGAEAREIIQSGEVSVNGEVDTRRGRQLQDGDRVTIATPVGSVGATVSVREGSL